MIMPGQQLVDAIEFMLSNAAENIGESSLGIDLVELSAEVTKLLPETICEVFCR